MFAIGSIFPALVSLKANVKKVVNPIVKLCGWGNSVVCSLFSTIYFLYMAFVKAVAWTSFAGIGVFMLLDQFEKHGINIDDLVSVVRAM